MNNEERTRQGGPAFPTGGYADGMTLRDYFAAAMLPSLVAHAPQVAAKRAYEYAEAMLYARKWACGHGPEAAGHHHTTPSEVA